MTSFALSQTTTPIELGYYASGVDDCSASTLFATTISTDKTCYDLTSSAESFHVGGPTTETQVGAGCTLKGYADKGCQGGLNLERVGPSESLACYVVGTNMGERYPVESVIIECS